jgi:uncharacterized protein involved in outer membrane biogenesis
VGPLRALLWMLATAVVAGLLAAWLLPPMLDWNQYRGVIAVLASEKLGRNVRIDGPIELAVLPQPMLTAAKVSVAQRSDGVSITASELRLRVAFWPLLSGRIDARELVLRDANMQVPWPLDPEALLIRTPSWLWSLSARVEQGRLKVGNVSFTGIDASLATGVFTGSLAATGTARLSGREWRFTARLGQPGTDGSASVDVTLDGTGPMQGVGAALVAQIGSDGTLAGRVSVHGPDLSQLLPAPAVAFKAEGRVTIASGLAAADDLQAEIGGSPARGAVALRVFPTPRLDVALATNRLDLDAWLPVLLQGAELRIPTGIDLSAEAAQLAGGTLRRLRGAFDLAGGVVEVREARAVLPGEASLRVAGRISRGETGARAPHFEGDGAIAAPNLRTTLAWLQAAGLGPFASLPDGVLRNADLRVHATVDPGVLAVGSLEGTVDDSNVSGSLTLRTGARFSVGAGLTVDRLDLNPWLPDSMPALPTLPTWFRKFDANLRLDAKQALLHGLTIEPLSVDVGAEAGRLTLRKLDLTTNGVHASGSATVAEGGRLSEGRLDLQAQQATPLAQLLPDRLAWLGQRAPGLWRSAANLQVLGTGPPEALALKVRAELGDLRLEAQPVVDLATRRWSGPLTIRHPGAPRLAEALGLAGAPGWLGDGSLGVVAQLVDTPERIAADSFEVTAGGLHASGALALDRAGPTPRLTGHVTAETLPLPLPSSRAADPFPIGLLRGWDGSVKLDAGRVLAGMSPVLEEASTTLTLGNGVLGVNGLTAKLGGGALTGAFSLNAAADPPTFALRADVTGANMVGPLFDLPLDLTSGRLDGGVTLNASGHSAEALLATLSGDAHFTVDGGMLNGVDLRKAAGSLAEDSVRGALTGGTTPFDRLALSLHVERGNIRLDQADVTAKSGTASLTGNIDLPDNSGELRLSLRPAVQDPPEIVLRLGGPLGAMRRVPDLLDLSRWHVEHAGPPPGP